MQMGFDIFMHCLHMNGFSVASENGDSAAVFSELRLCDAAGCTEAGVLYLCTEDRLPAVPDGPILLVCPGTGADGRPPIGRRTAARLFSERPLQELYIELLRIQNRYLRWKTAALQCIAAYGLLTDTERAGAKKVLTAAAMTYVASLAVAVTQLLRLLLLVAGNRRR